MTPPFPVCCPRDLHARLTALLPQLQQPQGIITAGLIVGEVHTGHGPTFDVRGALETTAGTVRSRLRSSNPQAVLAHLHAVLFEEMGFSGNTERYYDPSNSVLWEVISRRQGIPITLSLIYVAVARLSGLDAWGVGMPGHFLCGVSEGEDRSILVDPFHQGRVLTIDDVRRQFLGVEDDDIGSDGVLPPPLSHAGWTTRMLQNLLGLYSHAGHYAKAASVLELQILLNPEVMSLHRDLGLVLARAGHPRAAAAWLTRYLSENDEDPQRADLEELVATLAR